MVTDADQQLDLDTALDIETTSFSEWVLSLPTDPFDPDPDD
jgi:hypothetical protein